MHNPSEYFPPPHWMRVRIVIGFIAANWRGVEFMMILGSLLFGLSILADPDDVLLSCAETFLPPWTVPTAWPFLLASALGFAGIACNVAGTPGCRILRSLSGLILFSVGFLVSIGLAQYGLTDLFVFKFFVATAVFSMVTIFLAFLNLPPPGWRGGLL